MLVWNDKSEKLNRMVDKEAVLQSRINELSDAISRDESLLDMYESAVWKSFVETVLVPEKARLAERRMTIGVSDTEAHLLICGQYNEADALSQSKERLVASLNSNLDELSRKRDELAALKVKISKTEGVKQ